MKKNGIGILFVSPHGRLYGAGHSIMNTASSLDRGLFRPHVLALSGGPMEEKCALNGISFFAMPELQRQKISGFGAWLKALLRLTGFLKKRQILLVDYTVNPVIDIPLIHLAAFFSGAKTIVRNRGIAPYLNLFNKFLISRAGAVISVGRHTLEKWIRPRTSDMWSAIPKDRIHIIPDGRRLSVFRGLRKDPGLLWSLKVPAGAQVAGIVGSLVRGKRQDRFLQAAAIVRQHNPHVWFLVVGGGETQGQQSPYELELRELAAQLGIADRVRFTGYRADAATLIKSMDVIALTSESEGLPEVLIEARGAGVPAVSLDVGAVREVVEDGKTGFVLKDWNPSEFARKILRLLSDKELHSEMSRNAQNNTGFYDLKNTLRREVEIYCGLAKVPAPKTLLEPLDRFPAAEPLNELVYAVSGEKGESSC